MKRLMILAILIGVMAAACGGSAEPLVGIRASTDPAIGDSRYLFGVHQLDGTRRGSPQEVVTVVATSLDHPDRTIEADAVFMWIVPDAIGLYRVALPFDSAGLWQIDFSISTGDPTEPFLVDVQAEAKSVGIGEMAPLVATRTLSDTALEDLTTDSHPLASLYELSLDEALTNGKKTVVLFATPAFCTSAACGPMLDQTKDLAVMFPAVNFIHVEVYQGFHEAGFVPDGHHLAPAISDFRLPSEPWIFVMDESGTVIARFEGVLGEGEIEQVLGI